MTKYERIGKEVFAMQEKGMTIKEICKRASLSEVHVRRCLMSYKNYTKKVNSINGIDEQAVVDKLKKSSTWKSVYEPLGLTRGQIAVIARRNNIQNKHMTKEEKNNLVLQREKGLTRPELSILFGVTTRTVDTILKNNGAVKPRNKIDEENNSRICNTCGKRKQVQEFISSKRTKSGILGTCKQCHNLEHYARLIKAIKEVFPEGLRCSKCGYSKNFSAIDFHHTDPKTKEFNIGEGKYIKNVNAIIEELKKCEPICSNCHREHHSDIGEEIMSKINGT